MRRLILTGALLGLLTGAAMAAEKDGPLLQKLEDALASGEVVALVIGGAATWIVTAFSQGREKRATEAAELGRLKFKQEMEAVTRTAIRETVGELKEQLTPAITNLSCEIQGLKKWLATVDDRADNALRKAETLERTQSQWLKQTEAQIGQILSSEHPTLIGNLFFQSEDKPDD